jgi:phosphoglycolate phosphatase-like HAD superfamily hydrolase
MKTMRRPAFAALRRAKQDLVATALVCALAFSTAVSRAADPLPSWNDTAPKQAIVAFVGKVTKKGSPDFVPVPERIAVFDNDGTLWSEQPIYVQLRFALDRVKALAPGHPEWKRKQPFKDLLFTPKEQKVTVTEQELLEVIMATHAGMTTEEFGRIVSDWLATARHPQTGKLYTAMVYQPMLELLAYLRANGFKTFIVSGGGIEFMRPWAERVYGIPPEQVIGSSGKTKYEVRDGKPVILRLPEVNFIDDKAGKPVGIQQHIGRRPIFAAGNSDGDFEMLEWTTSGPGARLGLIVHHTDAEREWAYDRTSPIGRLDRGLDEGLKRGWIIVSMKGDWKTVFSSANQ